MSWFIHGFEWTAGALAAFFAAIMTVYFISVAYDPIADWLARERRRVSWWWSYYTNREFREAARWWKGKGVGLGL